ncbi:hypothetical protein LTR17_000148 [Elasticomyces elasticus]|nr:hypothetical protein LTR17_000148 [Elasticomyces elasticus]
MAKRLSKDHDDNYPEGYMRRAKQDNYPIDALGKHAREESDDIYARPPIVRSTKRRRYIDGPIAMPKGLLSLPPELRNLIYEYVLPKGERITFSKDKPLRAPALLQVSSQIRKETRDMFYVGNTLLVKTVDCHPGLCVTWKRHCEALGLQYKNCRVSVQGQPDWDDLMIWCKAIVEEDAVNAGPSRRKTQPLDERQRDMAMMTAFDIARLSRDKGEAWDECKRTLKALRKLALVYDRRWR